MVSKIMTQLIGHLNGDPQPTFAYIFKTIVMSNTIVVTSDKVFSKMLGLLGFARVRLTKSSPGLGKVHMGFAIKQVR